MTLQKKIEGHVSNEDDHPLGCISLENESGDFDLPQGVELNLRKSSDVTCSSNEGRNTLCFSECDSVTVKDFKNGILRVENCDQIEEISSTEGATITLSGAKIQKLDLKKSILILVDCEVEDCTFDGCEVTSLKNKFEKAEFIGCTLQSEDDEFNSAATVSKNSTITCFNPKFSELTGEESRLTFVKATVEKETQFTDCHLLDREGSFQKPVTFDGQKSTLMLLETSFEENLDITDASVNLSKVTCQKQLTITGGCFNSKDLQLDDTFEAENCNLISTGGTFSKDVTLTSCSSRLVSNDFSEKVTVEKGALDSEKNTYQKGLDFSQGTIESNRDDFSDDMTLDQLIAKNLVYEPANLQKVDFTGKDSKAILEIIGGDGQELTADTFGNLRMFGTTVEKLTITNCKLCNLVEVNSQESTMEDCGTLNIDDGDLGTTISFNNCSTIIANNCTGSDVTLDSCGQYFGSTANFNKVTVTELGLGVTKQCADLTADSSNLIDNGSTIQATSSQIICSQSTIDGADSCVLQSRDSQVTCSASLVSAKGGSIDAIDGTTVTSTGAEVTNPDGLTVGQTFDADLQGGCLLFDGINLTAQCTIGNVNINSTVGSIYSDALENIGSTAGIGIGLTAGEGIIADAVQDVALIAGAMITQDATTVQVTAASAFDVQAASNITLLSGGPVSLDGASVTINGAIISLN